MENIANGTIPKDILELASQVVDTNSGHFEPEKFEDHYGAAGVEAFTGATSKTGRTDSGQRPM